MQTLFFCCSFLESFYALCISLYLALYQALCTKCTKCTSFVSGTSCGDDQRSSQHWSRRLPWQFTGRPWHKIAFSEWSLLDPGIPGVRSLGLDVCMSIGDLVETDVTLTDEDTNSIKTDNANIIGNPRQCNVAMQPGGQIWNQCK